MLGKCKRFSFVATKTIICLTHFAIPCHKITGKKWTQHYSVHRRLSFFFFRRAQERSKRSRTRAEGEREKERTTIFFSFPQPPPPLALGVNKSPADIIFIRALDDLWRENRGPVNRLTHQGKRTRSSLSVQTPVDISICIRNEMPPPEATLRQIVLIKPLCQTAENLSTVSFQKARKRGKWANKMQNEAFPRLHVLTADNCKNRFWGVFDWPYSGVWLSGI